MEGFVEINFPSATGTGTIQARLYPPCDLSAAKGLLVQIVHGMAEHMRRYDSFCRFLAENGIAVCIQDLAGHGASAPDPEHLGYFGAVDGVEMVQQDIDRLAEVSLLQLSGQSAGRIAWRRVIFGHSLGSFIGRMYCTRPGLALAGAVFSGTSGANPMLGPGLFLADLSIKRKGPLYKDEFLAKMVAQGKLKRIPKPSTAFDWLCRDQSVVDAYVADPWCGYTFTAAGYRDLSSWLLTISRKDWAAKVLPGLPILLISGSEDPVGDYGKGVQQVSDRLIAAGHDVAFKLYQGARHEVLNELNKQEVWDDVLEWLDNLATSKKQGEAQV